jgi:hypothetical protein
MLRLHVHVIFCFFYKYFLLLSVKCLPIVDSNSLYKLFFSMTIVTTPMGKDLFLVHRMFMVISIFWFIASREEIFFIFQNFNTTKWAN